jgi:aspartate aminotransferase-like enzyme
MIYPEKRFLMAPGPTPIPERVQAAMNVPLQHHRTPQFREIFQEVRKNLQEVFETKQPVLLLTSSGTAAMEAAVTNLFSAGDEVLVLNAGKFGERWAKLATTYGLTPREIKKPWGESFTATDVETALGNFPNVKAVAFQGSETSTGAAHDVEGICRIAKAQGKLTLVDGITACGVMKLPMDAWGIDCLVSGSQKAFMVPPGLSMIALSEQGWKAAEKSTLPKFYLDLTREKKNQEKDQTAWTPAITLIYGLQEALRMMKEEGLEKMQARHAMLAAATRQAAMAMGLEPLANQNPSLSVSAFRVPAAIKDGKEVLKTMRDHYGVTIAGGQDDLEGKIFRLSHFGYVGPFDMMTMFSALELTLNKLGYRDGVGKGVATLQKFFAERSI